MRYVDVYGSLEYHRNCNNTAKAAGEAQVALKNILDSNIFSAFSQEKFVFLFICLIFYLFFCWFFYFDC